MDYEGYLLKINGVSLPYISHGVNIFEDNSYALTDEHPLLDEWTDINGTLHREVSPTKKKKIELVIKERTLEQHKKIIPILQKQSNIFIEFWDDIACEYKTGYFFMDPIKTTTNYAREGDKKTNGTIYYNSLPLAFTEY